MESCALIFNWKYKMAFNDREKQPSSTFSSNLRDQQSKTRLIKLVHFE